MGVHGTCTRVQRLHNSDTVLRCASRESSVPRVKESPFLLGNNPVLVMFL
jgi:hypothetical protein